MNTILKLILLLTPAFASASFTDVPSDHPNREAIMWAQNEGIVGGYEDGTFKPDNTINRAEFAKIIIKSNFTQQALNLCKGFNFLDTTIETWYTPYICLARQHEIISGYEDGTYRPDAPINYVEATKIIAFVDNFYINGVYYNNVLSNGKMVGLPLPKSPNAIWYEPYTLYIDQYNARPESVATLNQTITRGEMVEILWRLNRTEATTATITTNLGTITVELYPDSAPKTVENFTTHTENGYYDGLTFHRVIPDFMIQGGDPNGNGTGGESIWGGQFADEIDNSLQMKRGSLVMANAGPNTNGSQFFIVQKEDGTPWLEGRHTVFGKVIDGIEVVDRIANVETDENDRPKKDVTMSINLTNTNTHDEFSTITIHFYSAKDVKEVTYQATIPIERKIPYSSKIADQSLRALFAGPTSAESATGAYGSKDLQTIGVGYEGVNIYETFIFEPSNEKRVLKNVAIIDFNSKPEVWQILNGPAGMQLQVKAAIESTLTFYNSIDSVLYRKDGEIFYLWDA